MGGEVVLNGAETLSPLALFMQADIVVKLVMFGLLAASIWTWAIIINHSRKLRKINQETEAFEKSFWATDDIDSFHSRAAKSDLPVARVFSAGITEWRRSVAGKVTDREGVRGRLATSMASTISREIDELSDRLNILATVGSVAPYGCAPNTDLLIARSARKGGVVSEKRRACSALALVSVTSLDGNDGMRATSASRFIIGPALDASALANTVTPSFAGAAPTEPP